MSDILDPSAVLSRLPTLLPLDTDLKSPQDGLVALAHTALTVLAFRLVGVDDSSMLSSYNDNILPEEWNTNGPGHYTLRYKHEQSSLEFILKISKLGMRTVINAIAVENDKIAMLDITTGDYTSNSFYPYTPGQSGAAPLVHGFISSNRIKDFLDALKLNIIQKLIPGLRKEGYTESTEEASSSDSGRGQPPPQGSRQPPPAIPSPLHDPYEGLRGPIIPGRNPLEIGRQDLDPIPMRPNPFAPGPGFGGPSGDGMFVGPNHPIFSDRFRPGRSGGLEGIGGRGPWGGDGYLPPMGAPPGARFDPIAPSPPFGGTGGPALPRPGGPGLGRAPPRSGEPDNDEFMPPGMGDMYM